MKRISISKAKNTLSALLARVREEDTVVIENREIPVAQLKPLPSAEASEGRILRLERAGWIRRPQKSPSTEVLRKRPPRPRKNALASTFIIEERRSDR